MSDSERKPGTEKNTRRRVRVPGMSSETSFAARPHTPEDCTSAARPGFLTSGFLLAAPSHHEDSGKRAAFVPVTVAGAVPVFHRLPSTLQRWRGYELIP